MNLPNVDPTKPPPPERLRELTDAEVYEIIRWWAEQNYAVVGMQFWLDELSRRRTDGFLAASAAATDSNATQISELVGLARQNAAETAEMTALTRNIEAMTRTMKRFTTVNAVVAIVALILALVSLFAT